MFCHGRKAPNRQWAETLSRRRPMPVGQTYPLSWVRGTGEYIVDQGTNGGGDRNS